MFQIGNYVINTNNGICRIQDIVTMNTSGTAKEYYLLVPVEEPSAKVYIPVDMATNRIRPVITKEEAWNIIKGIPSIGSVWIENEKEREKIYKEALASREPARLISITKTLYLRKKERTNAGKKNTAVDERYFKLAENQLFAELAFALDEPKDNIFSIIEEQFH
ncbi:MAG: CarD family transcriptional regulator [Agathobacter sp.]